METELEERRSKFLFYLKRNKNYLVYIVLAVIIWIGAYIRTRNLPLLQNKFPLALDPHLYLRYAQYIVDYGKLFAIDHLRFFPLGADMGYESVFLPYFIAYLYKFLHLFNKSLTLVQVDILYPVITFIIAMVFFFLLVKALFNYKVALLSTAFLAVIPTFIYRTMAGFSDKESLAMLLMFVAMYSFVKAWQSEKIRNSTILALIAGIFTGLMGLTWGGVTFLILTISAFILIELFLNKLTKKDFFMYIAWYLPLILILGFLTKKYGGIFGLFQSLDTGLATFNFITLIVYFFIVEPNKFNIKEKIKNRLPSGSFSFALTFILTLIGSLIFFGFSFITDKVRLIITNLLSPFGQNRWALTVAESHQPYISTWLSQLGWLPLLLFLAGSIILFYKFLKPIGKKVYTFTTIYAVFIFLFIFSRYERSSLLNGENFISKFLFLGSIFGFILFLIFYYFNSYYKDKETFNSILSLDRRYLFVFIWTLFMIIAARSALRLLFVFSPIISLLAAFSIVTLFDYAIKIKENLYKISILVFIFAILFLPFITGSLAHFTQAGLGSTKYIGLSYNYQWQTAMDWVKANTPEDAVFAHWWDYGYWIQTGSQRATITDGGNWILPWNHYMGRHVITAQDEEEALEFLKTHNATHLLIIKDEIGKYPAFSSIGSDETWDRYSELSTFSLNEQQTQETRNQTLYLYQGGSALDQDFVYNEKLFPRWKAIIGGIILPVENIQKVDETTVQVKFNQPTAALFYQGQQFNVPLECIFYNGQEYNFEQPGLKSCLRIIPVIQEGGLTNPLGAGIYVSEKVRRTLFTQLYLFGKSSNNFKLVYSDESGLPLAIYQGTLIGPLKIWGINYPDNIKTNPDYLKTYWLNINVTKVEGRYT